MNAARLFFLLVVLAHAACGGDSVDVVPKPEPRHEKLVIFTVNYPLTYFAERVGGRIVEVHFPAPADEDPAFWSPDAETIAAYQAADLILLNGAGYARWVDRAALPSSRIVNTSVGLADRLLPLEGTVTHSHGPEGEHEHGGFAFTTWLDPGLAIDQVRAIEAAIALRRPEHEAEISRRAADLEDDLVDLDSRLAAAAKTLDREPLLFSHPVYQYLIRRYDLNAIELHWEPDQAPDQSAWDHLDEVLEGHRARWMLWESAPLDVTVRGLDQRDVAALVFNPCGNRPAEGDYLTAMGENAASLEAVAR